MGQALDKADVVKELQGLGLSKNEAEVYLFLARNGMCSVGIIARKLGSNRMSVYRILKVLEENGLIESTVERPSKYVALPVVRFLDENIEKAKTKISSLEGSRREIVDYCQDLQRFGEPVEDAKFRIVQGRKRVFDQISRMLEKVEKETRIIQTGNGLYRLMYSGIEDKLKALHDKGVNVMVLSTVDESSAKAIESFLDFAEIRHLTMPSDLQMVLVDEIEALTTFVHDDSMSLTTEKDLAMWVRAPDYAKSLKVFFQTLWENSTLAQQRMSTITAIRTFRKGLDWAKATLDMNGWTTSVPGKLMGESGVEHSYDFVAKYRDRMDASIVVDMPSGQGSSQILALDFKALDTNPAARLLVTENSPSELEKELANRRGIRLVHAGNSRELAKRIAEEAKRILNSRSNKTSKD